MLDFQKQFDTVTGALNIFDMSYLVSGSSMLGVMFFAFPYLKGFIFYSNHVLLSVCACIVLIYVMGMLSWVFGKQIRYKMTENFGVKKSIKKIFEEDFDKAVGCFPFRNRIIINLIEKDKNMAYSYMWMKLDKSRYKDCRSRFLYISRFWVLRAIYEGLIPPVIFLFITLYVRSLYISNCWCLVGSNILIPIENLIFCPVHCSLIGRLIQLSFIILFMTISVRLLAKEAKRCADTQIREVVVAYYNFIDSNPSR